MNAFPKMDFSKLGMPKLDPARTARMMERMARLQAQQAAAYARWTEAQKAATAASAAAATSAPGGETIDMRAPSSPGEAWTAPDSAPGAAPDKPAFVAPHGDIAGDVMRTIKAALAKGGVGAGLGSGLDDGLGAATPAVPLPDGARFEARTFTGAVGSRNYKVYVPSGYKGQSLPVVVMLHGCTQNPDDFARGTRMNIVAEEQTFLVVYPEQPRSANMQRCWNWYEPGDQQREGGEPALIAGIVRQVIAEFSGDASRVYAAGLSAGGAAAAILASTHPDLFAAVGVHSGLACGAARDMPSAFAAMRGGGAGASGGKRHGVPMIVFHGDGDKTVAVANGDQVAAQGPSGPDLAQAVSAGRTPDGVAYTRTVRRDASGRAVLEQWVLHGTGHAWSGGDPAGSFTDARGPGASREMVRFFLSHAGAANPSGSAAGRV
jgi:poly(hydroxyalkanoate) depolymerase family esterase